MEQLLLLLIIFSSFIFRILLTPYGSLPIDFNDWVGWSDRLVMLPFSQFYKAWSDYLPGYLYVLWILGQIKLLFHSFGLKIPLEILYKFPAILADLILVFIAYKISKKYLNQKTALLIAVLFAFNPAIFSNSTLWGQIDVLNTLFYILTFLFLIQKRILLTGLSLAIALLIKPQGVIILPFILILVFKEKWHITTILKSTVVFLLVYIGAFIPFTNKSNILSFIFERYSIGLNQYQYTSVNAFNFWAIGQRWWMPDSQLWLNISPNYWGIGVFAIIFILIMWKFLKIYRASAIKQKLLVLNFSLAIVFLGSFIFLTRVHERLLLTPLIFLMIAAIFKRELWIFVGILSVTYLANLYFSFVWVTQNFRNIFSTDTINIISFLNFLVFVALLVILLKWRYDFDEEKNS